MVSVAAEQATEHVTILKILTEFEHLVLITQKTNNLDSPRMGLWKLKNPENNFIPEDSFTAREIEKKKKSISFSEKMHFPNFCQKPNNLNQYCR